MLFSLGWVDVGINAEKHEPRPDTAYVMTGAGAIEIKYYRRTQSSGAGNHIVPC